MVKKILVTGATGFIGSHLIQALLKDKKYIVYGLIKPATNRNPILIEQFLKGATLATCDISDLYSINKTIKQIEPDVVAHLASLSPVRESFEKPFPYIRTNVDGTMNIAYSILQLPDFKKRKLVYASSAEVYGIQKMRPTPEDAKLNPSSPYAITKAMTDIQLRMMHDAHGLNVTVLRNTNTYGRKIDTSFFIEYLVTAMLRGEKIYIGAPDSLRDYMYVSDHVNAYIKAIEHPKISGEAFNAATGTTISNKDVAYKIADMVDFDKKKIIIGHYPPGYPSRPLGSDQPFIDLDTHKIRKMLGWKPKVDLETGLGRTVELWKART